MVTLGETNFEGKLRMLVRRLSMVLPALWRRTGGAFLAQRVVRMCKGRGALQNSGRSNNKPGTGDPLHTQEPVTVASFRTWRGWREYVA
jgi:hypothetical protein